VFQAAWPWKRSNQGLPEVDDTADLLLRLRLLSADVVELHAPVRVTGLEASDL